MAPVAKLRHHAITPSLAGSAGRRTACGRQCTDEVPIVSVRIDLVVELESVVTNDEPVTKVAGPTDLRCRDVLVIVERLGEPDRFLLE